MEEQKSTNEWAELSDDHLLYHQGRIAFLIEKYHRDNEAGTLDPKIKADTDYYNDIAEDLSQVEHELEERGYYENEDTGEWIASEGEQS